MRRASSAAHRRDTSARFRLLYALATTRRRAWFPPRVSSPTHVRAARLLAAAALAVAACILPAYRPHCPLTALRRRRAVVATASRPLAIAALALAARTAVTLP